MNNVTNVTITSPACGDGYKPDVERVSAKLAPTRRKSNSFTFIYWFQESFLREVMTLFIFPVNHAGYNRHQWW